MTTNRVSMLFLLDKDNIDWMIPYQLIFLVLKSKDCTMLGKKIVGLSRNKTLKSSLEATKKGQDTHGKYL